MSAKASKMTTVDIVIRLEIKGQPATKRLQRALDCLADVMRVQAEDGLWTHGYADAEDVDDVPNELVADIETARVQSIRIEKIK